METFISKCGKNVNTAYAAKVNKAYLLCKQLFINAFCSEKGGVIRSLLAQQLGLYVYMSVVDERSRIQSTQAIVKSELIHAQR